MMSMWRKGRYEEQEAATIAFLKEVVTPSPSSGLTHYGLQRVLARAESGEGYGTAKAGRRSIYRTPAPAYRVVLVMLLIPLVILLFTTGAYALSYDAQPGSSLYGTKIFFERARVTMATSTVHDIQLEMAFSDRRMDELENMASSGNYRGSARWLREYLRNIEDASSLLNQAPADEAEALSLQLLQTLDRQATEMEGMRHVWPSELAGQIDEAYSVCCQERERTRQRCSDGGCMQTPSSTQEEPGDEGQHGQGTDQGPDQNTEKGPGDADNGPKGNP